MRSSALITVVIFLCAFVDAGQGQKGAQVASPSIADYFGYNIAEKVTMDWGAIEQFILTLQMNEDTRGLMQELVDANPCVDSLAAFNSMLDGGAKLLIDNGPHIEKIITTLLSMRYMMNKMSFIDFLFQRRKKHDSSFGKECLSYERP